MPLSSGQHNKHKPFVLFYFIALFFFLLSLTHSFLYPPPNLPFLQHPLSVQSAAFLILPSNVRTNYFIFSITFNPEDGDSIYLRNTFICLLNKVSVITCQKTVAAADIQPLVKQRCLCFTGTVRKDIVQNGLN